MFNFNLIRWCLKHCNIELEGKNNLFVELEVMKVLEKGNTYGRAKQYYTYGLQG